MATNSWVGANTGTANFWQDDLQLEPGRSHQYQ